MAEALTSGQWGYPIQGLGSYGGAEEKKPRFMRFTSQQVQAHLQQSASWWPRLATTASDRAMRPVATLAVLVLVGAGACVGGLGVCALWPHYNAQKQTATETLPRQRN